jgi:hypothetical protein
MHPYRPVPTDLPLAHPRTYALMLRSISTLLLFSAVVIPGCGGDSGRPSPARTAVIQVSGETFRIELTTAALVAAAEAARNGTGPKIPSGRIVMGTGVNTGWSWHLEDVEFAHVTIELCDGRPSDVERHGTAWGGGRFCPWGAVVAAIE